MLRFVGVLLVGFGLSFSAQAEKTDLKLVGTQASHHFFSLSKPWVDDMKYVERTAASFCSTRTVCVAHFWEAGTASPKSLPLSDKEIATELAVYRSNKNTGAKIMMWQCDRYPGSTSKNCFR